MDLSKFKPTVVYVIYIASTPEKVWSALTSAEYSRLYFHGMDIAVEPRVGGAFKILLPDGSVHIKGQVIVWDVPRKLTITWDVNWPGIVEKLGSTLVTYDIEKAGEAVRLTVTQSNDRDLSDDILSGGRTGWPAILSTLKSVLETGKPLRIEMAPPMKMIEALKALGIKIPGQ